jgi:hypothetical protein
MLVLRRFLEKQKYLIMIFHLQSLFYALIFLTGLEIFSFGQGAIFYLSLAFVFSAIWGSRGISRKFDFVIPAVMALSALALLYLIDFNIERQIFIGIVSILFYLTLLGNYRLKKYPHDKTAQAIMAASVMVAIFIFYAVSYGIYLNFSIPLWLLMCFFLAVTFFVSQQYFSNVEKEKKLVRIYSIILGMIMAEVAWVINFWPFGYLTTGAISLILYYIFWDLTQSYFQDILSKRRVITNIVFFTLLITMLLVSSRWLPAV